MSDVLADNAGIFSAYASSCACVFVRLCSCVCVCVPVCITLRTAPVSTATAATLRDAVVCGARSTHVQEITSLGRIDESEPESHLQFVCRSAETTRHRRHALHTRTPTPRARTPACWGTPRPVVPPVPAPLSTHTPPLAPPRPAPPPPAPASRSPRSGTALRQRRRRRRRGRGWRRRGTRRAPRSGGAAAATRAGAVSRDPPHCMRRGAHDVSSITPAQHTRIV